MQKQERTSADTHFILMWACSALLEAPVLCVMIGWPLPLPGFLVVALHILGAACIFFAPPMEKGWFHSTRHWGAPLALLALLLPGVSWILAGWVVLRNPRAHLEKEAYRFEAETDDINPVAALGTPDAIRRQLADSLDVLPASDALLGQDPSLKRGAIETLSRIRTPDALAWVLQAQKDPDAEIRFYATSAITNVKREFENAIQAAEKEALRSPGDPLVQLSLVRVRYEFATAGILDPQACEVILKDCRARLNGYAERNVDFARLLYLVERRLSPTRALAALDRLEATDPDMRRRWVRERAELLFSEGRYGELRGLLSERKADLTGTEKADRPWAAAITWWGDA